MGGTSTKREQSATKGTPADHASDDAVAFRGGAGELQLKPCLPIGAALQRNPSLLATPIVCLPGRHYPALVLISAKPSFDFCLNVFETSRKGEMKYSFLARRIAVNVPWTGFVLHSFPNQICFDSDLVQYFFATKIDQAFVSNMQ